MQGFDFSTGPFDTGPSNKDGLGMGDLDPLDVDGLLNYLNSSNAPLDVTNPAFGMTARVPFRGTSGSLLGPSANLFSTIVVPETGQRPDSGDSTMIGDGSGERPSGQKLSAIQEKNRRAQKRFRERQKAKMKDMSEQLDDMNSELGKLRVENNALKNRNSILEKVLTLRDEHIRVLQDEQQVFDLGSHYLQQNTATVPGQKLLGAGPNSSAIIPCSNSAAALMTSDINAIKSMPADAVISMWKELVRDLGNYLVALEGNPDPSSAGHKSAMDSLCRALDSAGQMCMHTAVLHPTNMQHLIACTLDDGRSGISAEDRTRWAAVAAALQLSDDQKSQVIALRQIFVRRMTKVLEDRRGVLAKLQAVAIPDRMVALQSVITETLKVNEATVALKSNLQEEHLCGMEFIGTVFKTIFSPLQKAHAIVQSYPFYPDVFQIASALAAERGGLGMLDGLETGTTTAPEGGNMGLMMTMT